jgi:PKD repeat protein
LRALVTFAFLSIGLATIISLVGTTLADPVAEAGTDILDYTGRPVVFQGLGSPDPTLRIILYEWDFDGDGTFDWNSTRTGSATNVFPDPGEFNSSFRVTQYNASNSELLTAEDTTHVRIRSGQPVGQITSSNTAERDAKHPLVAEYYDPDGGQLSYLWRIDGVEVSELGSFKHTFDELGVFNVTLTITDDEGEQLVIQMNLQVVEDVKDEIDRNLYYVLIAIILVLVGIAGLAYRGILKAPKRTRQRGKPKTYDELGAASQAIVTEASMADVQADPETRRKPKVVRPERVVITPGKQDPRDEVPAAPARMPCPECGTTMDDTGTCPFCESNEGIDAVEKSVRDLQDDGYIIAEVEDRVETAKTELHVKNFEGVRAALDEAMELMDEAVREHDRCLSLMSLVDELILEAKDRDIDVTKASNLIKLSKSFMKSGKYPKAIHYAERSRDFLLENLEPFDLDRYFCVHCRGEVEVKDIECPHCDKTIESGLIKRARSELGDLLGRFEALVHEDHIRKPIASQLEEAGEHVDSGSAAAANEHIQRARQMLDQVEDGVVPPDGWEVGGPEEGPMGEGDDEMTPSDEGGAREPEEPEGAEEADGEDEADGTEEAIEEEEPEGTKEDDEEEEPEGTEEVDEEEGAVGTEEADDEEKIEGAEGDPEEDDDDLPGH